MSFEPSSQRGLKKNSNGKIHRGFRASKHDGGRGGVGVGLDDPSLLYSANSEHGAAGYEELSDLEGQKGMQTKRGGLEGMHD